VLQAPAHQVSPPSKQPQRRVPKRFIRTWVACMLGLLGLMIISHLVGLSSTVDVLWAVTLVVGFLTAVIGLITWAIRLIVSS
jgi:lysylphosphatidylglycerol synthetase-like protein (DUF2156 family)